MPPLDAADTGQRDFQIRVRRIAHVIDVITAARASVEAILVGVRMISDVKVVIAPVVLAIALSGNRNLPHESGFSIRTIHHESQIVDQGDASGSRREQKHPAVGVLVDEDVVEAAGTKRFSDPVDLPNRGRIRKSRDV